jgi:glycosyltransferase involved in cell wall biosynthesis
VSHKIRSGYLSFLISKAERFVYKHADIISANNPAMQKYCQQFSNRTSPSCVNLPPLDIQHFEVHDQEVDEIRTNLGISRDARILMYMGSFFYFSGLDVVIKDFSLEAEKFPQIEIVLVGGGEQDQDLRDLVSELRLESRVHFAGFIPYQELPKYLRLADVALNPLVPDLVARVALPHKVFQYIAAEIPVVSTNLDGLKAVLGERSGVTWVKTPNDILGKAISITAKSSAKRKAISNEQLENLKNIFSVDKSTKSLEDTLVAAIQKSK